MRYYDECRDPAATRTSPLRDDRNARISSSQRRAQAVFASGRRNSLGSAGPSTPTVGDPSRSVRAHRAELRRLRPGLPADRRSRCGSRATERRPEPVVRTLLTARVRRLLHAALAVPRLQRRRTRTAQPRLRTSRVLGGCGRSRGRLLRPASVGAEHCVYDVLRPTSTGERATTIRWNIPANFTVSANGVNLPLTSWTARRRFDLREHRRRRRDLRARTTSGSRSTGTTTTTPTRWHRQPQPHSAADNRCEYSGRQDCPPGVRRDDDDSRGRRTRPDVAERFVPLRLRAHVPAPPLENVTPAAPAGSPVTDHDLPDGRHPLGPQGRRSSRRCASTTRREPDAPLRSELHAGPGVHRLPVRLRAVVRQELVHRSDWWNSTTKTCPQRDQLFSYADMASPYGTNSSGNPWQCVPTAPGSSTGQTGDGMAVATKNCKRDINNNSVPGSTRCVN